MISHTWLAATEFAKAVSAAGILDSARSESILRAFDQVSAPAPANHHM